MDDAAFKKLTALLTDKGYRVRSAAISALGDLGDKRAIGALKKSVKSDPVLRLRGRATAAIGKIETLQKKE